MSDTNSGLSRRTLAKGAAWAVPAVAIAAAAPAMAASKGPISFTGRACKLPGAATDLLKGYVFELVSNNVSGPQPRDTWTVITSVTIGTTAEPVYEAVVKTNAGSCSCACSGDPNHKFCTPDGTLNQRILVYTGTAPTGNSQNTNFTITYQQYDCNNTTTCSPFGSEKTISSGPVSTPPRTSNGGGSCQIPDVLPLPT